MRYNTAQNQPFQSECLRELKLILNLSLLILTSESRAPTLLLRYWRLFLPPTAFSTISCSVKMWSKTQLQFSFGANYRTMVDLEKDRKISKNLVKFWVQQLIFWLKIRDWFGLFVRWNDMQLSNSIAYFGVHKLNLAPANRVLSINEKPHNDCSAIRKQN